MSPTGNSNPIRWILLALAILIGLSLIAWPICCTMM